MDLDEEQLKRLQELVGTMKTETPDEELLKKKQQEISALKTEPSDIYQLKKKQQEISGMKTEPQPKRSWGNQYAAVATAQADPPAAAVTKEHKAALAKFIAAFKTHGSPPSGTLRIGLVHKPHLQM